METIELLNREAKRVLEKRIKAWEQAGSPPIQYAFGPGTFPDIAKELADEWQGVRPHEETIYVRVA